MPIYNNKYKDELFIEDLNVYQGKRFYSPEEPQVVELEGAIILPFVPQSCGSVIGKGGVLDREGNYVSQSGLEAEQIMSGGYAYPKVETRIEERTVYLGYFLKQWGHFLVDFLPRIWWLLEHDKNTKLVYLSKDENTLIDGNYLRVLQLAGINTSLLERVGTVSEYRKLIVPELSLKRPLYWTDSYRKIIEVIVHSVGERKTVDKKIYWTRTNFRKAQETEVGEKQIEAIFKKNGFAVLSPEKISIEDQIYLFSHCEEFAALSGTVPHNIVFAGVNPGRCKVTILNKTHRINTIQILLNDFADGDVTYVDCNYSLFPVSPGSGPFWVGVNKNLLSYIQDRNWKIRKKNLLDKFKMRRYYLKYCLMYARCVRNGELDLDGVVLGSSRPINEKMTTKPTYFHYRNQLDFPTYLSIGFAISKVWNRVKMIRKD